MIKFSSRYLFLLLAGLAFACSEDDEKILPEQPKIPEHVVDHAKELIIPYFEEQKLLPFSSFTKSAELVTLELPHDKAYWEKLEITNRGELLIRVDDEVVRLDADGKRLNSYGFAGREFIDYNYDPYNDRVLVNTLNPDLTAMLTIYAMDGQIVSQHQRHVFSHDFGVLDANHLVFYDNDFFNGFQYTVTDMNLDRVSEFTTLPVENTSLGITSIKRQNQVLYAHCKLADTPYRITAQGLELLYRFNYIGPGEWGLSLFPEISYDAYCSNFWLTDRYLIMTLVNADSQVFVAVKDLETMAFYSGNCLDDDVTASGFPYVDYLDFQQSGDKLYILTCENCDGDIRHYLYKCAI